eukprot:24314_4
MSPSAASLPHRWLPWFARGPCSSPRRCVLSRFLRGGWAGQWRGSSSQEHRPAFQCMAQTDRRDQCCNRWCWGLWRRMPQFDRSPRRRGSRSRCARTPPQRLVQSQRYGRVHRGVLSSCRWNPKPSGQYHIGGWPSWQHIPDQRASAHRQPRGWFRSYRRVCSEGEGLMGRWLGEERRCRPAGHPLGRIRWRIRDRAWQPALSRRRGKQGGRKCEHLRCQRTNQGRIPLRSSGGQLLPRWKRCSCGSERLPWGCQWYRWCSRWCRCHQVEEGWGYGVGRTLAFKVSERNELDVAGLEELLVGRVNSIDLDDQLDSGAGLDRLFDDLQLVLGADDGLDLSLLGDEGDSIGAKSVIERDGNEREGGASDVADGPSSVVLGEKANAVTLLNTVAKEARTKGIDAGKNLGVSLENVLVVCSVGKAAVSKAGLIGSLGNTTAEVVVDSEDSLVVEGVDETIVARHRVSRVDGAVDAGLSRLVGGEDLGLVFGDRVAIAGAHGVLPSFCLWRGLYFASLIGSVSYLIGLNNFSNTKEEKDERKIHKRCKQQRSDGNNHAKFCRKKEEIQASKSRYTHEYFAS